MADEVEGDDDLITCWCGATGTYEELFDDMGLPEDMRCGGLGVFDCKCGGDLCVCHHHGEVECDGCPDCEADDDGFGYGFDDDDY